jgi:hypothetical protein
MLKGIPVPVTPVGRKFRRSDLLVAGYIATLLLSLVATATKGQWSDALTVAIVMAATAAAWVLYRRTDN